MAIGLFLALNGIDYANLVDPFRDGKIRYLFMAIAPIVFLFLRPTLTFAPAWIASYAIFSFAIRDFMWYGMMPLLLISAVMVAGVALVKAGKEFLAKLLIWSGVFQALIGLAQVAGLKLYASSSLPVGLYGHETVLGPFLVACLCPALWRKRLVPSLVIGMAIALTQSSMTYAALGAVLLVFIWHEAGWQVAGAGAILGAFGLALFFAISPEHNLLNINGRGVMWNYSLQAIGSQPVFGSGVGSWVGKWLPQFFDRYLAELGSIPVKIHSDYLDFLVEYGAIGALPLAASGGLFLRNFRPSWTHAVCVGILVNAIANFPLTMPSIALIFVACWAHSMRSAILRECEMR